MRGRRLIKPAVIRPVKPAARTCSAIPTNGKMGTISWDGISGTVELLLEGAPPRTENSTQTPCEMLTAQTKAFLASAQGGHDQGLASGDDGVKALAICDAARRSAQTRREEPVNYP